jgi:hypothetical protein
MSCRAFVFALVTYSLSILFCMCYGVFVDLLFFVVLLCSGCGCWVGLCDGGVGFSLFMLVYND